MKDFILALQALNLGQFSYTELATTIPGGYDTGWFDIEPAAPFEAVVLYCLTMDDFPSGIFNVTAVHRGQTVGTKTAGVDGVNMGAYSVLYITAREKISYKLENLDSIAHTFTWTLWYLNVMTLKQLDIIKLVAWEYFAPGVLPFAKSLGYAPEFENLTELQNYINKRYPEWKG